MAWTPASWSWKRRANRGDEGPKPPSTPATALHDLGVHLAIDDFGTGCSSLAYLGARPVDVLKIDRSIYRDIETDRNDAAICASILAGQKPGPESGGQGGETALAGFSASAGDYLQGYFFARPQPAAALYANGNKRRPHCRPG